MRKKLVGVLFLLAISLLWCGAAPVQKQTISPYLTDAQKQIVANAIEEHSGYVTPGALNLVVTTDLHMVDRPDTGALNYRSFPRAMTNLAQCVYASQLTRIDGIAVLGDVLDGGALDQSSNKGALNMLATAGKVAKTSVPPVFIIPGNHDDNSDYRMNAKYMVKTAEWVKTVVKPYASGAVYDTQNTSSPYYYRDYEEQKIRVIFLAFCDYPWIEKEGAPKYVAGSFRKDNNGYGWSPRQCQWLGEEALNFSQKENASEWATLVFSHARANYSDHNGKIIMQTLDAYNLKTAYQAKNTEADWAVQVNWNFSKDKTAGIIGFVQGHTHLDYTIPPSDNIDLSKWQISTYSYPVIGLAAGFRSADGFSKLMTVDRKRGYLFFTTMAKDSTFGEMHHQFMVIPIVKGK